MQDSKMMLMSTLVYSIGCLVPMFYLIGSGIKENNKERNKLISDIDEFYENVETSYKDFCEMWPADEFANACLVKAKNKNSDDRGRIYYYANNLRLAIKEHYVKLMKNIIIYKDYTIHSGSTNKIFDRCKKFSLMLSNITDAETDLRQTMSVINQNDVKAIKGHIFYMSMKNGEYFRQFKEEDNE